MPFKLYQENLLDRIFYLFLYQIFFNEKKTKQNQNASVVTPVFHYHSPTQHFICLNKRACSFDSLACFLQSLLKDYNTHILNKVSVTK